MTDPNKSPSDDILRDISKTHADQPGDLGKTVTDKDAQPNEHAQAPSR